MKKTCIKMSFVLVGLFFVLIFSPDQSYAQTSTGITISPDTIRESFDPGEVRDFKLKVTNLDSIDKHYFVILKDIKDLTNGGQPIFADENEISEFTMKLWVTIASDEVDVAPKETKEIDFKVTVPEDAGPGAHLGGIFLSSEPPSINETGVAVRYQVGSLLLFKIEGDIVEEALIREFTTDKIVYWKPGVKFTVVVENNGSSLIMPRGPLEISSIFGKKIATLKMNDAGNSVLPNGKRTFELEWTGEWYLFGRYDAAMGLLYGDANNSMSASASFWILPMKIILPFLGGIIVFLLAIFVFLRLHIRKKLREIQETTNQYAQNGNNAENAESMPEGGKMILKEQAPLSKLMLIVMVTLAVCIILLLLLFFSFA